MLIPKTIFGKIVAVFFIVGAALLVWSTEIEPDQLKFNEYPVYVKDWPDDLAGFSIAFITDTHVGSPHITLDKLRAVVDGTNARKPDMVLLGGDYVVNGMIASHYVPSKDIADVLGGLHAAHGVYGILGNHDWMDGASRIRDEFENSHIAIMDGKARHITAGAHGFWLAGVSDYYEGPHDMNGALKQITSRGPVILFTHSPDLFPHVPARVSLGIAGHTHGGQVYVPFLGRPVIPSKYGQRYAMGIIREDGKTFFVGSGIGTSILPVRFLTPPEVSILRLYPEKTN